MSSRLRPEWEYGVILNVLCLCVVAHQSGRLKSGEVSGQMEGAMIYLRTRAV